VKIIAARESGDNPGAVLRGHGNMLNPVSDIIAAYRYAVDRYGSVNNVPGVQAVRAGGAYVGY
jgi:SLT domain-containing protein